MLDEIAYFITPVLAWLTAGFLKFFLNSIRSRGAAFDQVGYGGFPSNHTTIVTSAVVVIALGDGLNQPIIALAVAILLIVVFDAMSLRRQVGSHAEEINRLSDTNLRERMGHTPSEIAGGLATGSLVAAAVHFFLS